jgi:cytochrome P450
MIEDRRAGKVEGWNPESSDILSILMRNELYTDNTLIANECCLMFTAGSKTVQASTSNLMMYMNNYPEVAKKL